MRAGSALAYDIAKRNFIVLAVSKLIQYRGDALQCAPSMSPCCLQQSSAWKVQTPDSLFVVCCFGMNGYHANYCELVNQPADYYYRLESASRRRLLWSHPNCAISAACGPCTADAGNTPTLHSLTLKHAANIRANHRTAKGPTERNSPDPLAAPDGV
jgi:hypothetical protein